MDKLKAQLAPVTKHWFWIAAVLVMLGSVATWWLASGKLITEFTSAESKIASDDSSVTSVSGKLNEHPNPKTHLEMEKLIADRKKEVLLAWQDVYDRQQGILIWPVKELQDEFVREFKDLTPIELAVAFPTPEDVEKDTALLSRYKNYIGNVLPGIAEIAKTKWTANFETNAAASGMGAMMGDSMSGMSGMDPRSMNTLVDEGPLVNWSTGSQDSLLTDLFPWRTGGALPKTLQVLYSQENLWILRQLMQIVASVNGDAAQRFQAKIREINRISIGSSVSTTAGSVSKPASDATQMMGGMGDMGGMGGMSDMGMDSSSAMSMDSSMGGGGAGVVEVDPGDNRYVDTAGKPILAAQLRAALSSNSPTDAFMAVAKRIPVMMSLKMDQRAVPELLAKCGSAQLMVEVKQVRILSAGASAAASGPGGSGMESGMGMDSSMGSGMDSSMGGMAAPVVAANPFPFDLDIEIYGIIYIYNPPLAEKLGVEKVNEDTVIDGTAMVDGSKVEEPAAAAVPAPAAAVPAAIAPAAVVPEVVVPEAVSTPEALPAPSATDAGAPANAVAPPDGNPSLPAASVPATDPAAGPAAASGARWDRNKLALHGLTAVA